MFIFLFTELMLFAGFVSAFLIVKANAVVVATTRAKQPRLPIEQTLFNSSLLLMSGILIFLAHRALRAEATDSIGILSPRCDRRCFRTTSRRRVGGSDFSRPDSDIQPSRLVLLRHYWFARTACSRGDYRPRECFAEVPQGCHEGQSVFHGRSFLVFCSGHLAHPVLAGLPLGGEACV